MPLLAPDQLDAYLARIGVDVPATPTLAALDTLIAAQLAAIPFENVDPLLKHPVRIDIDSVFDKLVTRGRGGYCFELNTLFASALAALGYAVTPLAARVRWGVPPEVPTPQSHMLLRVEAEHRSYIVDVGFGGPTPYRAMPLSTAAEEGFPYRLAPPPAEAVDLSASAYHVYDMEARGDDEWLKVYRFDLTPQPWIDYEPRNWYVCTHPDSIFLHVLMAARTEGAARLTLANGAFTVRQPDGAVEKQHLSTAQEIVDILVDRFGLQLDDTLRAGLIARLPALLSAPPRA